MHNLFCSVTCTCQISARERLQSVNCTNVRRDPNGESYLRQLCKILFQSSSPPRRGREQETLNQEPKEPQTLSVPCPAPNQPNPGNQYQVRISIDNLESCTQCLRSFRTRLRVLPCRCSLSCRGRCIEAFRSEYIFWALHWADSKREVCFLSFQMCWSYIVDLLRAVQCERPPSAFTTCMSVPT